MPTYQYRCTECGRDTEAVQAFTDAALTECPHCGGLLRKQYGAVGVVFKGSGFYRNDSRGTPKSEAGGSGEKTSGSDAKPESTPATASSSSKGSTSSGESSSGSAAKGSDSSGSAPAKPSGSPTRKSPSGSAA